MSTLRNGDPLAATRGAAHRLAKKALGDAIDDRIELDVDRMELELLASVIGCGAGEVRARLDAATLGELLDWTKRVRGEASEAEPEACLFAPGEKGAA